MTRIGLISDTHGQMDPGVIHFFSGSDEIWHAGDIGDMGVISGLGAVCPLKAVYGNIDDFRVRTVMPGELLFRCEDTLVYMTHITGFPGKYAPGIKEKIRLARPALLVGGHSHILRVMYDMKNELLYMNPGAAGRSGPHGKRTALRFRIDGSQIRDLEILELPR